MFGALLAMVWFSAVAAFVLLRLPEDWRLGSIVLLVAGILTAMTLILAWLLARLILRPVRALSAKAVDGAAGVPLEHYGTAELAEMGQEVLSMARRLENRAEDMQSYAQHITHELKSPLTTVSAAAELLEDTDLSDADRVVLAQRVAAAAARMRALLDALQALAQAGQLQAREHMNLSAVFDSAAQREGLLCRCDGEISACISPFVAEAVFTHLAQNAAQHGASLISLYTRGQYVFVEDDGNGISAGNAERIFDPFFTTQRDYGGTGMGLAIVQRMLRANGGDIAFSPAQSGARFRVSFPR
ncbi:MAG: HAMP domain-containing sensor histidine kinase [Pseudomonadota bacterium]